MFITPVRVSLSEREARTRVYIGRWSSRDIAFDNESQFRFEPLETAPRKLGETANGRDDDALTVDHGE